MRDDGWWAKVVLTAIGLVVVVGVAVGLAVGDGDGGRPVVVSTVPAATVAELRAAGATRASCRLQEGFARQASTPFDMADCLAGR